MKIDLQLFAEEDYSDFVLPDEEVAQPEAEQQESEETGTPPAETEQEMTEEATEEQAEETSEEQTEAERLEELEIKFLKEHKKLKDFDKDELKDYIQKGMNYGRVQEKLNELQSNPALALIEEQAKKHDMTVDQYVEAVKEQEEQARLNELLEQNIPEEYAREMLENRKFREEQKAKEQSKEQEKQKEQENIDFLDYFEEVNGKQFNPKQDKIPEEVWQLQEQGVPLKFAYMQAKQNELQAELKALRQKEDNAKKAPISGGVTGHGSSEIAESDDFLQGFDSIK